jgi:hypothetical protein
MRTHKDKFLTLLERALKAEIGDVWELMLSTDSDDHAGMVSVKHVDKLNLDLCQFTYYFGPHSWFPIVLHTSGQANEQPTPYRWHHLEQAFSDILQRCREQKKLRL